MSLKYNKILTEKSGTPVLFLLPMLTDNGRLRKRPKSNGSIDFLERWLIAEALQKNPELVNNMQTHLLRNLHVTGIFNPGQGEATAASRALRNTLSLP
jgi:hypothetical protein